MTSIHNLLRDLRVKGITLNHSEEGLEMLQVDDVEIAHSDIALVRANKEQIISYLKKLSSAKASSAIPAAPAAADYPVSSSQKRLWILSQSARGSVSYNMPFQVRLDEQYDVAAVARAIRAVIARHEILRTVFAITDQGDIRQRVLPINELGFEVSRVDCTGEADVEAFLQNYRRTDAYRPFDLEKGPLLRTSILKVSDTDHILYLNIHHIISDEWSLKILFKEILAFHEAFKEGTEIKLPELKIQYKDYACWQQQRVAQQAYEAHKHFWLNTLSEELTRLDLPSGKTRPAVMTHNGHCVGGYIPDAASAGLKRMCREEGATLFMGLLASWNVLLYRYTSGKDILIGSPVSGRYHADLNDQIGFYVNTVLFQNAVDARESFAEHLRKVKASALAAYDHQEYPFDALVEDLPAGHDPGRNKVFDVLLALHEESELPGQYKNAALVDRGAVSAKLDIELSFHNAASGLYLELICNSDVYEPEMINGLLVHYVTLLESIVGEPGRSIGQLNILPPSEKTRILGAFNDTATRYPEDQTVLDFFNRQVAQNPGRVAVAFGQKELTFGELNAATDRLASYLARHYTIRPGDLVGIRLHRSEWLLVAILAVMKSGAAYVPIDPDYPEQRLQYIRQDSNYVLCIDENELNAFFSGQSAHTGAFAGPAVTPDHPAYVIYTSGSTGVPKGVLNKHAGLFNRLMWMRDDLAITGADVILQKTPYTFDVSVWELLMPLVTGSKLVFARPEGHKDPHYLQELIEATGVSIVHFVPSMLGAFLTELDADKCRTLRHVVCSGEALPVNMANDFKAKLPATSLHNYYGPTEAAIDVTAVNLSRQDTRQSVSIGAPVANTRIYITNEALALQPVGVAGELVIGGVQVAHGYLNRPELNEARFVASPFAAGERLYRTGDLARWRPDGQIEYIGRKDNQVKIRGNRVEIGEIESVLQQSPLVRQSIVTVQRGPLESLRLVAYVVPDATYDKDALLGFLAGSLPYYMVPSVIVELAAMPIMANGKVNRKALPAADPGLFPEEAYVAPRNPVEAQLAAVWASVLGKDKVGVFDNYFQLGGDSIIAIRLISRVNKGFDAGLKIDQLYQHPCIADFALLVPLQQGQKEGREAHARAAQSVEALKGRVLPALADPERVEDVYPMSDIQKGMVVASLFAPGQAVYHDQFVYKTPRVDAQLFEKALALMVTRHAILRTVFDLENHGEHLQIVLKHMPFRVDYFDLKADNAAGWEARIRDFVAGERSRAFNFTEGPLWRCSFFNLNATESIFVFQFHHAILDGWSVASFNTELFNLYQSLAANAHFEPRPLSCGYKEAVIQEIAGKENHQSVDFWKRKLDGYKRLEIFSNVAAAGNYRKQYDAAFLKKLKEKAAKDGVSVKTVLFGACVYALKMLTYEDEVTIGLVSNNRPVVEDGDQVLGCFLNTLPVRVDLGRHKSATWSQYFRHLEKEQVALKQHERLTLLEISNLVNGRVERENPFFDVFFNFIDFHVYEGAKVRNNAGAGELVFLDTLSHEATNTVLDITLSTTAGRLGVEYKLRKEFAAKLSLAQFHSFVEKILENYLAAPGKQLGTAYILSPAETLPALHQAGQDAPSVYAHKTITAILDEVTRAQPDALALVCNHRTYTRKELDALSNQFSAYLRAVGNVTEGDLVCIMLPRSEWYIVSILSIIKLGAAYVPIDENFPEERKRYIREDSTCKLCITSEHIEAFAAHQSGYPSRPVPAAVTPDSLLYVIYTSGTTGKPKGVKVAHANLAAFLENLESRFGLKNHRKVALTTNFTFDISVLEVLGSLCTGKELHLFSDDELTDPGVILEKIGKRRIEVLQTTPSRLTQLLETNVPFAGSLRVMIVGGEAMDQYLYEKLKSASFDAFNAYGPTETTIWSTCLDVKNSESVSIGTPLYRQQVWILDAGLNPQPYGVTGEICIGGVGVTKGYLNAAELTAQKFVDHPFAPGQKLYRTGDLGRWLPDGNLGYAGRKDDQVKIRGYRIELGEVEHALLRHGQIEAAVVLAKTTSGPEKQLVAYLLSEAPLEVAPLRSFLAERLPAYMIPGQFVQLDRFPLTTSGKVDRKALLASQGEALGNGTAYTEATNGVERMLVHIWQTLFNRDRIGINDNFFELGGNSITAIKIAAEVLRAFNVKLQINKFFLQPTIAEIAMDIANQQWQQARVEETEIADSLVI